MVANLLLRAYQGVLVGTIKKHAIGKGNAAKDEMIASVRERGHSPADDNESFAADEQVYRPFRPSPEAIDRMLETMRWGQWLEVDHRHLVWMTEYGIGKRGE